ncbi:unnamed protein product, partial [Rotaria sp. Silwood2]
MCINWNRSGLKSSSFFSGYNGIAQPGSNSYGGVAILYSSKLKVKIVEKEINFLVVEIDIAGELVKIGAIYVPPLSYLPFHLCEKYINQAFIFFGDYNAKHTDWNCPKNNPSGNQLFKWLERSGVGVVYPNKSTSRKSEAVIDFGITNDANDWQCRFIQTKLENRLDWMTVNQNIWKYTKPIFHKFSPLFRGLTTDDNVKETNPKKVIDMLANYYEKHFEVPSYDKTNPEHVHAINTYQEIANLPNAPLEQIKYEEVLREWNKFRPKKSTDSANTSAFLLKKLPLQFISIVTYLFNKCAEGGMFFKMAKHAKVICLSKDGLYPT